jgi:DNA polymerase III subunit epsilon
MIKSIFLDLETTGVDYMKHGIYQIGGIIRYDNMYEEFEYNCDIFSDDEINPEAFANTNVKPEDLRKYPDPYETYLQFTNLLLKHIDKFNRQDKLFFINFGAEFDSKFLRRWFESNGDDFYGSYFWHPPLEVQSLAMEYLKDKRAKMPNFKLSTVCKELGINVDERQTHTALYDAKLAMQAYDIVARR